MAAYALLVLGGNEKPTADDVAKLLKEAGCNAESDKIARMIESVQGKGFHTLVAEGLDKMSSMGSGAAASAPAGAAKEEAAEEKGDDKKEEEEEVDMGGLFDEDDEYS